MDHDTGWTLDRIAVHLHPLPLMTTASSTAPWRGRRPARRARVLRAHLPRLPHSLLRLACSGCATRKAAGRQGPSVPAPTSGSASWRTGHRGRHEFHRLEIQHFFSRSTSDLGAGQERLRGAHWWAARRRRIEIRCSYGSEGRKRRPRGALRRRADGAGRMQTAGDDGGSGAPLGSGTVASARLSAHGVGHVSP